MLCVLQIHLLKLSSISRVLVYKNSLDKLTNKQEQVVKVALKKYNKFCFMGLG